MEYFQGIVKLHPWLTFLSFLFLFGFSGADDPPFELCSTNTNTYSDGTPFQKNLNNLLQSLRSKAGDFKFFNTSIGTSDEDKVYGLFMCFNYVPQESCRSCIATASEVVGELCPNAKQAVLWPDDQCQLSYSDRDFAGSLNISGNILLCNVQNVSNPEKFRATVDKTLRSLADVATNGSAEMYAIGEASFGSDTLYALVQCTRDLSPDKCHDCLGNSTWEILDRFYFSVGGRVLSRSCYLRYELYAFYKGESEDSSTNEKQQDSGRKIRRVAFIIAGSACLLLAIFCSFACFKLFCNRSKNGNTVNLEHNSRGNVNSNDLRPQDSPCVDFSSILAATGGFLESNKLGQGSFGPVYKGVLRGGKEVAVKRLLFCSEQGSDEFTNEVLLIMKLQHKNLVKLLGFCSDRNEKLLVYEYMPNKSLDSILFDPRTRTKLEWKIRINIITGIARGILYLHEDSRLRVIHRDLKSGNILLDSEMNPKISDFGIARILAGCEGESHTSTIIGTYGYMAPEYAMEGIYSIKSDVYSFGVLLLEIISGKSINAGSTHTKSTPSLIAYAWHLWQSGQVIQLIDPFIRNSCESEEFLRYMHIGLLCIQEDALDRPTMSSVVVMLKSADSGTLSQPKRPAFFTGRLPELSELVELSSSVNSFTFSDVAPRS